MSKDFFLPELGENIDTATVIDVLVWVGDNIVLDQALMNLETDKAEFELPCTIPGTVEEILVSPGDDIKVGQIVLRIANADKTDVGEPEPPRAKHRQTSAAKPQSTESGDATQADVPATTAAAPKAVAPASTADSAIAAAPSVRKLARELGIVLQDVVDASGRNRITSDDLRAFAAGPAAGQGGRSASTGLAAGLSVAAGTPLAALLSASKLPDFSAWGEIETEAMSKIRRKTAENMSRAWIEIPQVTQYDNADITELDVSRKKYAPHVKQAGGRLTWTAILLQVVARTLAEFHKFNASVDMAGSRIIYKKYVHIGIAVDTERGLLVPVVRDADKKNILELAADLREVSERAKNRNIKPDMMQGATFTITNLGGIGGVAFSPIVNPPQVAILGVSRSEVKPQWVDGSWQPRLILPLALSYDHRVIDGADAARFLRKICEMLEEPLLDDIESQ